MTCGECPEIPEKVVYFPGCMISTQEYGYEMSLRELFPKLGIEMVDAEGFSCCGMPTRHLNLNVSLYLGLRNLAVAEALLAEPGLHHLLVCCSNQETGDSSALSSARARHRRSGCRPSQGYGESSVLSRTRVQRQ